MLARFFGRLSRKLRGGTGRHWYPALGVSTLLHVGLIVLLAALTIRLTADSDRGVETRWTPNDRQRVIEQLPQLVSPTDLKPIDSGGAGSAAVGFAGNPRPLDVDIPQSSEAVPAATFNELLEFGALAEEVGDSLRLADSSDGSGGGEGQAAGDGSGAGFFGINEPGLRFVYVVDSSTSMNHPHESESKTRFRRLKLELINSIGRMQPTQEFFIIFFNDEALPMPARALQPAYPRFKRQYLEWAAKMRAVGDTDPRDALRLALRLEPDVIYFLTDGSFAFKTESELSKLSQQRVAIHTFAMGNRDGEPVLRLIAQRNRGKYHFIP